MCSTSRGTKGAHAAGTAIGGIAMAVGAVLPIVLALPMDRRLAAFLGGATVVLAFGVWDDRRDLRPATKLLGSWLRFRWSCSSAK